MQEGKKDATPTIRMLIDQGLPDKEIVKIVKRNASTVSRARKKYERERKNKEINALAEMVQPAVIAAIKEETYSGIKVIGLDDIKNRALLYEANKAEVLNNLIVDLDRARKERDPKMINSLSKAISLLKEPYSFLQNLKGLDK
jgi:hypothetical protein